MADLQIRLAMLFDAANAQKASDKFVKGLKDQEKTTKLLSASMAKYLKDTDSGLVKLSRTAQSTGNVVARAFSSSATGLEKFSSGVSGLIGKFVNLKNVILASSAAYAASKIIGFGQQQIRAEARARREFGSDAPGMIALSKQIAKTSGRQEDDILSALTQIGRATSIYQEGSIVGGKKLSAEQAAKLRRQTTEFGAKLLTNVATLERGIGGQELGDIIANAGSGPEGVRRLISTLGLPASVKRLNSLNEGGKIAQGLTPEEKARYAKSLTKNGGRLLPGEFLELALDRGKIGREAEAYRKTAGFQLSATEEKAKDKLGDLGQKLIESFQKFLGHGKPLSERFDEVMGFVEKHSSGIGIGAAALGSAYVGGKAIGLARSLFGGAKGVAGKFLGAADSATAIPVRVVNWDEKGGLLSEIAGGGAKGSLVSRLASKIPGVGGLLGSSLGGILSGGAATAAAAGLAIGGSAVGGLMLGRYLDNKTGASDWISKKLSGAEEAGTTQRGSYTPEQQAAALKSVFSINIGNINAPATTNKVQFVESIMSEIRNALTMRLHLESAGRAAPVSAK